ncbi:unnamed protein product [Caenorhabditis angaria]|uniref:DUF7741 domain-containing protein n=1 Tax=Caenorhabditis angaria TaxID=860376 RepID=A0A9P1N212_9PELO|nr:unnamed protein product [Caenorhabditis angaria]
MFLKILIFAQIFLISRIHAAICYTCYGNSTAAGKFCSIDKLCTGTSCYFNLNSDDSWEAGCSSTLSSNSNITCATDSTCSCNSDFCNSLKKSQTALTTVSTKSTWHLFSAKQTSTTTTTVSLTLPNKTLVYCEECGSVTVGNETLDLPCDHDHTCQGNFCVAVRGPTPYSYCGGTWDETREPGCYFNETQPEKCICSMNMCNSLLDPAPIYTTTASGALADATVAPLVLVDDVQTATEKTATTTRKCKKSTKLSPNDQAVAAGEKLKNVIVSGFGSEDESVQNFGSDMDDVICSYSDDSEDS